MTSLTPEARNLLWTALLIFVVTIARSRDWILGRQPRRAHPPAMLIGYLILAGVALTDWIHQGPERRSGRIVVYVAFILAIDALIQVATLLAVAAIITFLVRMWPRIKPAAWTGDGAERRLRHHRRLSIPGPRGRGRCCGQSMADWSFSDRTRGRCDHPQAGGCTCHGHRLLGGSTSSLRL